VRYKIPAGCFLFFVRSFFLELHAQDTAINSRADQLFVFPFANVSSLQGSYDYINTEGKKFYNTYLLRGLYTLKNNRVNIRIDIPFASVNPAAKTVSGLDDASVRFGFLLKQRKRTFYGARTNFKFPTASRNELGTGKYIFEPSAGLVHFFKESKGTFSFGLEYTQSYAGEKIRPDVSTLGIIANADRWFKKGYVGYYPTFRYNFNSHNWNIPLDIEGGYMFAKNWWIAGEYILPLANPKTFNYEFTFKLKRVFIRKST
jgi:hypothetical protein